MKKTLSLVLALMLALGCVFALVSCGGGDVAGTYEMTDISGSTTSGGVTSPISKDMFEYYTITLNNDGTGTVASKANGASTAMEQDIEWELDGSVLKIITNSGGMKITEEMTYENGVITYDVTQSLGGGNSMSMHLVLEKQ